MKSISGKHWEELKSPKRLIEKIKIDHNFNTIQAKIIVSRHFSEEEIFSINNQIYLTNPFVKNKDFLLACKLLNTHIQKNNKILIIGDYDVDGCLSTSLMVKFLKKNNAKYNYYIPNRIKDGYGASKDLIKKLINIHKPKLTIFLDCGSSSYEALKFIKLKKINSLIIDHHNVNKPFPLSDIFINPKKNTEYKSYDYLCTVFLTYLFIDLYIKINQLKISIKEEQIYVLLATVADVMPIRGINRILSLNVLNNFKVKDNLIFNYLFDNLNIKKKLELDLLGYIIAPIFNSAGRLNDATKIVKLLTTDSNKLKIEILKNICDLNKKRKFIENECLKKIDYDDLLNQRGVLFIYKPNLHEGIIGIIASKIKEYFNKPCIVLTNSNKLIKGSARSTLDFNIGEYIQKALDQKILISGGGHNLAAGVSLLKSNLDNFKKFIDHYYKKKNYFSLNNYVSKILLDSVNKEFINNIEILGPFGNLNENPIFLIEKIKIIKPKIIKEKFISFFVKKNNRTIKALSFNNLNTKISYHILNSKNDLDILVKIKDNKWNYKSSIELEIIDIITNINKT